MQLTEPIQEPPEWVKATRERRVPDGRPWSSHVSPSESVELDEYLSQPGVRAYEMPACYWHAHTDYARRAALSLALGDLFNAQRAAAISAYAHTLFLRWGGTPGPSITGPLPDQTAP